MVSLCLSYVVFLSYNLITHKKISTIFHKKFEFEAGYYSLEPSSIFHFIQIFSPENGGYFDKFDSKYIRAYTTYVHPNFTYEDLDLNDHWVFDTCRKDIDNNNLESNLFNNVENFTNGVCIRHFYNSTERKYYSLGEKGFLWPYLEHGISQRNNIYLNTIIQKCSNDSVINEIFGKCPPQKEIDEYISKYIAIYLYFTDSQVDLTNYYKPIQKYFQIISTNIATPQTFVENFIHYSPLRIKTKYGSIFTKTNDINFFNFDFNRKGSASNLNEKYFTITKYYHLMQNNVQIYERTYNNIFDTFSEIGGIIQFIFYLFYWINYAYNKFIISYDINSLFFAIKDNQYSGNEFINNKKTKENKININGNNNKIYNIKNNIINISKIDLEKSRYSNLYNKDIYSKNEDKEIQLNEKINKTENSFENTIEKNIISNDKREINNNHLNDNKKKIML